MSPAANSNPKLEAARSLLAATKRSLQIVDEHLAVLGDGRVGLRTADDVSSEHRTSWLGAVDDLDALNGIKIGLTTDAANFGLHNAKTGTIRNQEDAGFVCTDILVALGANGTEASPFLEFAESVDIIPGSNNVNCLLRLTDGNTGRSLITGMTTAPLDRDRGAVPFSYLSSIRHGLGANQKNRLFSEFTIPRAGIVRAEIFNVGIVGGSARTLRACVTLLGYKVFGG